jgi:prolyl-tRNA synthetase
VSEIVRGELHSYRQLPLRLYQATSKFRDEVRPRFGLLRSREFLMKDLYSFDASIDAARQSYALVSAAYERIFARIGIPAVRVLADSGNIGGDLSHEFHLPSNVRLCARPLSLSPSLTRCADRRGRASAVRKLRLRCKPRARRLAPHGAACC